MNAFLLGLSLLIFPQNSSFDIEVDASRLSEYTVRVDAIVLRPGTNYQFENLIRPIAIVITVSFLEGEERHIQRFTVVLTPGQHRTLRIYIPRVYPKVVEV